MVTIMARNRKSYIICGVALVLITAAAFVYFSGMIGISADYIERDARASQRINGSWEVATSASERTIAMLFYDGMQDEGKHTFSIYAKHPGLSFGYFFRAGGSASIIRDGIYVYLLPDDGETTLLSMNKDNVARIEIDDGIIKTHIDVDPSKPFAVVLPVNSDFDFDTIRILDMEGNAVSWY